MSPTAASPFGPRADAGPPGLAAKLLGFCEELRNEGVAVGTSELLDAFAALDEVPWTSQDDFREALAATLAKSQEDRRLFELLFERWFFRAAEAEAIERDLIERTSTLPPSRPLAELDRALPTSPTQDLAAVHRAVSQLKRRLATLGHEQRGRRRGRAVDVRRTMRASLETGGVPLRLRYRPKRPRRPEIYVLCDVSTSVTSASVFFLSVLHALHDSFRKLRSFVFIERISEVTEIFEHERDFRTIAERVSREGGVADVSGYTDYERHCDGAFECWTTRHLENFVNVVAGGAPASA